MCRRTSCLTVFGISLTVLYISSVLWFLLRLRLGDFHNLSLNELGDFSAGILSPLAIFWLVLGFFQQGIELRNSVKALEFQAEELRYSVAAQRQVAEASTSQLNLFLKQRDESIWLEMRKNITEINYAIGETRPLLRTVLDLMMALMSFRGALQSGAMIQFEQRVESWRRELEAMESEFQLLSPEAIKSTVSNPDVMISAKAYELRYWAFRIRSEVIGSIEEDKIASRKVV